MRTRSRGKFRGWLWAICLSLCLSMIFSAKPSIVLAENDTVSLSAIVGLDGNYGRDKMTQIEVSIQNHGPAFSGVLKVSSKTASSTVIVKNVEIQSANNGPFFINVPGTLLGIDASVWLESNGQRIAEAVLKGNAVNVPLIGVWDTKVPLSFSGTPGDPTPVVRTLYPSQVQSVVGMESINVILLHELRDTQMSDEQAGILKNWVERGGMLITDGDLKSTAAHFAGIVPQPKDTSLISDLTAWSRFSLKPIPTGTVQVSDLEWSKDYKPFLTSGDRTIIGTRDYGSGKIAVVAYDLTAEPLVNWSGSQALIRSLLTDNGIRIDDLDSGKEPVDWQLINASLYMSQVSFPSLKKVITVFVIYMLLVAPILYLILRRFDRREWGWVAVPGIALLFTGGIFLFGSNLTFLSSINQAVGVVTINSPDYAKVEAGQSYVVARGGDYSIKTTDQALVVPIFNGINPTTPSQNTIVSSDGNQIDFHHVEYNTIRNSMLEGELRDVGGIVSDIRIKGSEIQGTVANHTKFDLKDVRLRIGHNVVILPDLAKGQSVPVNVTIDPGTSSQALNQMVDLQISLMPIDNKRTGDSRYSQILSHALQREKETDPQTVLYAWTEDEISLSDIQGTNEKTGSLYLIRQAISVLPAESGKVSYPWGLIGDQVVMKNGFVHLQPNGLYAIQNGSIELAYNTQVLQKIRPTQIEISMQQPDFAAFKKSVWNNRTSAWDEISTDKTWLVTGEKLDPYIDTHGSLRIRFENTSVNTAILPTPSIRVEGEVK